MSLASGDRLGAYRIVALLGAGGMGEVYRARDPRLGREVAIKILPASFCDDADRLRRFDQEARAASALNHPNILAVYDVGTQDGTPYVVSELLEGRTLGAKIDGRPLPLGKALDYAIQLARGLAAAHAKGIAHRDLKPENVFVTTDGRLKILDFGLAKVSGPAAGSSPAEDATVTATPHTTPGMIVGTAGYMAPEQVRGLAADHRCDIFSFGVVFYEMLAGRRAFTGGTAVEAMTAILTHDPVEALGGERALRPDVERLLRHCLEKDPDARFQSARDLTFNLESLAGASEAPAARRAPRLAIAVALVCGLAAGGLLAAAVLQFKMRAAPASVTRFTIDFPPQLQFRDSMALSPDGRTLVYSARDEAGPRLYRRALDTLDAVPIQGTEGGSLPFFSPDGASLGFRVARTIKRVPLQGGAAVAITEMAGGGGAATWLPDDTIVFGSEGKGLWRVPSTGGQPQAFTVLDAARGELEHRWPMVVPGGQAVAFTIHYGARDTQRIDAVRLDSGARVSLAEGNGARFLPTNHIVFQRLGSLWIAPFDRQQLRLTSPPTVIVDEVGIADDWSPKLAVGADGSLAYATGGQPYPPRTVVWVDRQGSEEPAGVPLRAWFWPQISPDARRLGFHDMNPENMDAWIYDRDRSALIRMTFNPQQDGYPIWSPDGTHIAFWSRQAGEVPNLYVRPADLTGGERRLTTSPNAQVPFSWANGGKTLVYHESSRENGTNIGMAALDGATPARLLIHGVSDEAQPAVSPDGRWIAYQSNVSRRWEVYVQPFPDLGGRWQLSTDGGVAPIWHPNGRELFFRRDRAVLSVPVETSGSTFKYGSARTLFERSYVLDSDDTWGRDYAIAPDGRFLMLKEPPSTLAHIVVAVNWGEELNSSSSSARR